jgi:pyruvate dehydrogenase E2 component (dihydrolipoamide acetyltransferase)
MISELTLPRLGETMETGRVAAWLKQPGERFRRGETLVEIESDKTVVEMPALADGVLHEIIVEAGQDADVGAVLCRYDDGRNEAPAPAQAADTPAAPPATAKAPAEPLPLPKAEGNGAGVRATPLARRIARQNGVILAGVPGTGPRGRIEADDVRARAQAPQDTPAAVIRDAEIQGGRVERRDWTPSQTTGPRTVLLHGLAADVQSWAVLAAALMRAGRPVTAIDLPGHGGTELEALDIDSAVAAVVGFLDQLGGEAVDLVGHSFGGVVAARAARHRPGRVRQLTLLAPAGLDRAIDTEFVRGIVRVSSEGALAHLLRRLVVRPAVLTPAQLAALAAELGRGRLIDLASALVDEGGQRIDITGDLRALEMPTRIVWGLQDRIIPWTQVKEAGSRCAIHLIPDAGHVPHWDQPAEVAALFD